MGDNGDDKYFYNNYNYNQIVFVGSAGVVMAVL